ncbi:peroxin-10 [Angomonas deanei]|uniref:RING-type E3 ubiquitin transferase n=1 Tax=Angomonas deanei TaxID=59799 RepID=A0A7G2CC86_9TRYP|nr:peroxin-10 [Angomonas deanei]CAD2217428.1 Pex2 / Pex12 amino terminal region/Anaphase-promoting complex subunit 11 RING-H2 finger/Zinc finger, C3HC4 type (RING finger)/Ring finger domain containing protein, putative [Angomonas deanei]|eukprot:EPY43275.1 peroxin-10 [Angomonas deanei]
MQPATAPFILRSIYKDDYLVDTRVVAPATELLTNVFGAQWTNRYDKHITPISKGVYRLFSMCKGPTLGEEFCDLLPVVGKNPYRTVGATRGTILSLLFMVEPATLFYLSRRFFPSIPSHDVISIIHKVVSCLLFLFEGFGTIPHRLTRVKFLSLQPSQVLKQGSGAPGAYFTLGLVLVVELVVRMWRYSKQKAKNNAQVAQIESSSDDEEYEKNGKCMLCLSHRKCPTATQCGHIFCWNCICEWIHSNPAEAICPFCRQHITSHSLVTLYFYASPQAS